MSFGILRVFISYGEGAAVVVGIDVILALLSVTVVASSVSITACLRLTVAGATVVGECFVIWATVAGAISENLIYFCHQISDLARYSCSTDQ